MKNSDLRKKARKARVPLWKVADELGVSEPTMTRRLRYELSGKDREKFLAAVEKLASEGADSND